MTGFVTPADMRGLLPPSTGDRGPHRGRALRRAPRLGVALVLASVLAPGDAAAQEDRTWGLEGELGASLFFGASDQTAVIFRSQYEQDDEAWDVTIKGAFTYGEAEDQDGTSFVNKRSWSTELSLDYTSDPFVPFLFGGAEGSIERQIDVRLSGGAGTRLTLVRNDRTRLDVSVGLLGEYTQPRRQDGEPAPDSKTLVRWSNRIRANRRFLADRGELTLVAFYKPAFQAMDDYTIELDSSISFALNSAFSFKVSLVDRYDNLAVDRGAQANNDGRLYVSFLAAY